jgi:5'(3')-deoxyribonucleotidase
MKMKKIFLDLDGTLARFNVKNALQRFATEKGFFANLKAYKNIEEINELAKGGNVYIISASPNLQADNDKMQWISEYLFNVPSENIVICRVGENKAEVIKSKLDITIDKTTVLLDDYTKNLVEWESAGGVGIKRLTKVADNSTGKWKGLAIRNLNQLKGAVSLA